MKWHKNHQQVKNNCKANNHIIHNNICDNHNGNMNNSNIHNNISDNHNEQQ